MFNFQRVARVKAGWGRGCLSLWLSRHHIAKQTLEHDQALMIFVQKLAIFHSVRGCLIYVRIPAEGLILQGSGPSSRKS
jgi:hypothetical protein